jgi:hypothetical protein
MSRMIVAALIVLGACAGPPTPGERIYEQEIHVEINPDVDFDDYASFDVLDPVEGAGAGEAPFELEEVHEQLTNAIIAELTARGLTHDTDDPALLVNPLVSVADSFDRHSFYQATYGWYWGYEHQWTVGYELRRGSLVLDVVDLDADLLVYRGTATDLMAEDADVIKLELRNATRTIFAGWPRAL